MKNKIVTQDEIRRMSFYNDVDWVRLKDVEEMLDKIEFLIEDGRALETFAKIKEIYIGEKE